ncbi:TPA: SDR family NAD(P)-dependent oxidoreductase [Klebsiella variicola subsp. variicola]
MNDVQKPLNSGFSYRSTASEVVSGLNLTGLKAVVTGGHSGIGFETSLALSQAGAQVIVGARQQKEAESRLRGTPHIEVAELDLSRPESIADFTSQVISSHRHIDILICSAGIMACPETRTPDGQEMQFAVNHLGHYVLINQLWPLLTGSARVVLVSSAGHHASAMRWNDLTFSDSYDKWLAYGQSKTANALCAVHLDRIGKVQGVRAFSLHPGKIFTPLQRHLTQQEMTDAGWLDKDGRPADPEFKTPQQGAATQVWAATSPSLDGKGGVYCEDCDIAEIDENSIPTFRGVRAWAVDPSEAERLWQLSASLTGIDAVSRST